MKDIETIAAEKYPYPFATEDYPTTVDASRSVLGEIDKLRQAFISGSQYGKEWVSVEDSPLFTKDIHECWTLTDNGMKEFLAAVPYEDKTRPDEKSLWWIRHCIIDDGGLKIVGDVDNEPAGWSLEDVTHYQLLPSPPIK